MTTNIQVTHCPPKVKKKCILRENALASRALAYFTNTGR